MCAQIIEDFLVDFLERKCTAQKVKKYNNTYISV